MVQCEKPNSKDNRQHMILFQSGPPDPTLTGTYISWRTSVCSWCLIFCTVDSTFQIKLVPNHGMQLMYTFASCFFLFYCIIFVFVFLCKCYKFLYLLFAWVWLFSFWVVSFSRVLFLKKAWKITRYGGMWMLWHSCRVYFCCWSFSALASINWLCWLPCSRYKFVSFILHGFTTTVLLEMAKLSWSKCNSIMNRQKVVMPNQLPSHNTIWNKTKQANLIFIHFWFEQGMGVELGQHAMFS